MMAGHALAASVSPSGYTNDFSAQPPATDWATLSRTGGGTDSFDMDSDVNANITASSVTAQTTLNANNPATQLAAATWSSSGLYLQTRPTGNRYTALMGKFVNNTGTNATQITLSYLFTIAAGGVAEETGKGTRVYYSTTGLANTWTNLPVLNTTLATNGTIALSTNLAVNWTNGASLYLLWADDNASAAGTDAADQIDSLSLRVTAGLPPGLSCVANAPANNAVLVSGTSVTASASVFNGMPPYVVSFWTNGGVGNTSFGYAGSMATAPYETSLGNLPAGSYNIFTSVTDQNGDGDLAYSLTNSFSVADPILFTLTAPGDGATFDTTAPVTGAADVSGGTAPYSVQFYLDNVTNGAPVTSAPFERNFGALFVGDHTIKATVGDSKGWVSTSLVSTVHITGPLAVTLAPTNGAAFNYGQALTLTAVAGGGTAPYAAAFFVNDQLAGSLAVPPFTWDLGLLPVGSYTCSVHATDSSLPTAQQADSTTNVIRILTNPLAATLTTPTSGQNVGTNVNFAINVNASVSAPVTVSQVDFYYDGALLGSDATAPYSFIISNRVLGSHSVYAVATDSLGRTTSTATNQMNFIIDPLANDNFTNRLSLVGPVTGVTASNVGATTESGEPVGSGFNTYGTTLWWSWVAPATGTAVINTTGSSFNIGQGVFTGASVNALTRIAFAGNAFGGTVNQVTFTAQQGTEYQIQIAGMRTFGGSVPFSTGSILFSVQMPPTVTITSPMNNSTFMAGSNIFITANATSVLGAVRQVDFYAVNSATATLLGTVTNAPYNFLATNAPLGSNNLYAVVTDAAGQMVVSASVPILVLTVGVTIVLPADGATFGTTNPITLNAVGYLPSGSITNVEFFVDGQKFSEDNTVPFSARWTNVVGGSHRLTATGQSDAGEAYNSQPVNIAVSQVLLASNSIWKYLDTGVDQGTNWIATDFNDSSWSSGPAPLGYSDSNGRLPLTTNSYGPDSDNKYPTTYFRQTVVLSNLSQYATFTLNLQRDDGAIVYVNGTEAGRFNMPSGPIGYTNFAAANASDDGATTYSLSLAPTLLREGPNVFAVEIHQESGTSSDIWFVMELLGVPPIIRNQYPLVALIRPASGAYFYAPATVLLEAKASDSDGQVSKVEFFLGSTKLAEVTNAPYTLTLTDVPAGAYTFSAVVTDDQGATNATAPVTITVYDLVHRWTAYNDHATGPNTHPNATAWNAFGTEGGAPGEAGPLRNIATGAALTANLTVLEFGAFPDGVSASPLPGTPAYTTFNELVDFGSGGANDAILVTKDSLVFQLFTGLDPLRRYSYRGTAAGGVGSYSNRWTLFTIIGASAFTAAHTANVLTSVTQPALADDEAAMNTGDNRVGDVVGWDNIVPGSDGTFIILASQYVGPAPGNAHPGPGAYAPVALLLEEFGANPLVAVTEPTAGSVIIGPTNLTISATASALVGITNVLFLGNGSPIGHAATPPYSIGWSNAPFGPNTFAAVAYDARGIVATSAPVTMMLMTPDTNTVPPMIFSQSPAAEAIITNFASVQVTFTETVTGVDASDLLINDVPATNVVGSGSNYVFRFVPPPYGSIRVRFVANHGITDLGWPLHLAFYENEPEASWNYLFIDATPPTIIAKNPPAGSALTNLVQLSVTFSEPVSGVNASDLLVNGTPAFGLSSSGSNYTFAFSQPASGTVNISWAAGHGITDLAVSPNAFNATGAGATWSYTLDAKTVLVQSNSYWFFAKGTNEASTPTNAWRFLSFDDSGWSNAPAPFFYGDPYSNGVPAYTWLSDMRSNYSSIYLRKPFVVPNAAAVTNLFLRGQIDDGMIVWINGVEVLRTNAPAGEVPYSGVAPATSSEPQNSGAAYLTHTLPDPRGYLVSGTNVIAVHALNESLTSSSDFGFNAQLYTYQANTELVAPRLVSEIPAAGYVLELTNLTVTFSEPVVNVEAADLLINGVPATDLSSPSNTVFTFSFAQPPYGPVAITWATDHGIVDLDLSPKPFDSASVGSTWPYTLLNPNSPYLYTVAPAQGTAVNHLTQINVAFSEPVMGVDAADLLLNGTQASGVAGSDTNYTFTFSQPAYGTVSVQWATNHGITDFNEPPQSFDTSWPNHTWSYALVDQTPPAVASQNPPASSTVASLTQLTVTFTEPVAGVDASDLLIHGKPATGLSGSNASYTFTFARPNASLVGVTWATNHGIHDLAAAANPFDATAPGATWSYTTTDTVPPSPADVKPVPYLIVRSLTEIKVTFDEPVSGVDASDLFINGTPALQVTGSDAGPYTFFFNQPATGQVQIAWAVGHGIQDLASPPNAFADSSWTYVLDPAISSDFAVKHVIHISLDGAGAYYIENYINSAPAQFANFVRLTKEGAWTLNARTDYDNSVTLPNHACMFTGRPVLQPAGWANTTQHGLTIDQDNSTTIHNASTGNPNVPYKYSVFDVAHDNGLSTAFLYSKQSLTIFTRSWNATYGAADTNGVDNGSNKIDDTLNSTTGGSSYGPTAPVVDALVNRIATNSLWNYTFMHFDDGDATGHASGWGSVAYSNALRNADQQIGRVLNAVSSNPALSNNTIVIVTADHGGTGSGHSSATALLNYRIPLFVWGPGIPAGVDLYSLFANRADPGTTRPSYSTTSVQQPLRDGDVGNLAATLLGLPSIPGSSLLSVFSTPAPVSVSLALAKSQTGLVLSWPASAIGYELQAATLFGAFSNWQTITNGITIENDSKVFNFSPGPDPAIFFRLRKN